MTREEWLALLAKGGGLLVAVAVGIPAVTALVSPALGRSRQVIWRSLGDVDQFPVGRITRAVLPVDPLAWPRPVQPEAVFVWRQSESSVVVFARSCTDLGCPLTYDPGSMWFFCPCHGAVFDTEGSPRLGPPDRAMYRYANRIRARRLEVDLGSVPPMV